MTNKFFNKIVQFFKRLFGIENKALLPEASKLKRASTLTSAVTNYSDSAHYDNNKNSENSIIEDKNIIMYLYKELRLGNIEAEYIPDEYLEPIQKLLKEEEKIKKEKIANIKQQIDNNKKMIKMYSQQ